VVRVLADILRESGKEKVTRIIIATLRVKKFSKNEPGFYYRVVRKTGNVNPGLMLSTAYVLCGLRLLLLKTEGQKCKQDTLLKSYKNEIKILANPGLA